MFVARYLMTRFFTICLVLLMAGGKAMAVSSDYLPQSQTLTPRVPLVIYENAKQDAWQEILVLLDPLLDPALQQLDWQVHASDPQLQKALDEFKLLVLEDVKLTGRLHVINDHPTAPILQLSIWGLDQLEMLALDPRVLSITKVDITYTEEARAQQALNLWRQLPALRSLRQAQSEFSSTGKASKSTSQAFTPAPAAIATSLMLSLQKAGSGTGTVSDSKQDLVCNEECQTLNANLPKGVGLKLEATPAPGSRFNGWENASCADNTTSVCSFEFTQSGAVTARFTTENASILSGSSLADSTVQTLAPLDPIQVLAVGDSSFVLQANGQLWRWGSLGQSNSNSLAVSTLFMTNVVSFAASDSHVLAIKSDGTLWAWGLNDSGQLGDGTTINKSAPVQVSTGYVQVAAGYGFSLALQADGTLMGWGRNNLGQLGVGDIAATSTPLLVGHNFKQVSAGPLHALAIKTDNSLWAWGANTSGQLGVGNFTTPSKVPLLVGQGFTTASASGVFTNNLGYQPGLDNTQSCSHSLAIKSDGSLWSWGHINCPFPTTFILLPPAPTISNLPILIGNGFSKVSTGLNYSTGIKPDGSLWSWGMNTYGQLGSGNSNTILQPANIGSGYKLVSAGSQHVIAVKTDNTVWVWGQHDGSKLGSGRTAGYSQTLPSQLLIGPGLTVSRSSNSASTSSSGTPIMDVRSTSEGINCLGLPNSLGLPYSASNDCAQSYTPGTTVTLVARDVDTMSFSHWEGDCAGSGNCILTMEQVHAVQAVYKNSVPVRFVDIANGGTFVLAIDAAGDLWGGGYNSSGQLLSPPDTVCSFGCSNQKEFQKIGTGYTKLALGTSHVLALKADGSLWTWGSNSYGQLGDSTTTNRYQAQKIGDGYTDISAGGSMSLAIKNDQTLWAWGSSSPGSSSSNQFVNSSSPQLIGNGYRAASADLGRVAAITTQGNLKVWSQYALPSSTPDTHPEPNFIKVSVSGFVAMQKNNGDIWTWLGSSNYGTDSGNAAKMAGPISSFSAGYSAAYAVDAQNQLWAWGENLYQQLGVGTGGPYSTPQLVGQNFAKVSPSNAVFPPYVLALSQSGEIWAWGAGCSYPFSCPYAAHLPTRQFIFRPTHSLQLGMQGTGSGNVTSTTDNISCNASCNLSRFENTKLTLSPRPNNGSVFAGWTGACTGTGTCEVTLSQDAQVGAIFNVITFPLTVSKTGAGSGRITSLPVGLDCGTTCSFSFGYDDLVTLHAEPLAGHNFEGWSGDCTGTSDCDVLTYQARQVSARFTVAPDLSLSRQVTGSGSVKVQGVSGVADCTAQCQNQIPNGTSLTLSAQPAQGYVFKNWSGACSGSTNSCSVNMDSAKTVVANFITLQQKRAELMMPILMMLLDD